MKILDNKNNLKDFLLKQYGKEITMVSAFASNTEKVIQELVKQENKIKLIIGTINAFSSPVFFKKIREQIQKNEGNLSLSVDFGYENSIHWKLYLIKPATVIVGSANFTDIGLKLERDTCVIIKDESLYDSYVSKIETLERGKNILDSHDADFKKQLEAYEAVYERVQFRRINGGRTINIEQWLKEEANQRIPVFIWHSYLSDEEDKEAEELFNKSMIELENPPELSDTFLTDPDRYHEGDVVLCMGPKGKYLRFYIFDKIIRNKHGRDYVYSYKRDGRTREGKFSPFTLDDKLKRIIIKHLSSKEDRNDFIFLDRVDLNILNSRYKKITEK